MDTTDWAAEAVRLRREESMATAGIAERVGRSASQVRKVIAAANTDRAINGAARVAGNPSGEPANIPEGYSPEMAPGYEPGEDRNGHQTTVDDFIPPGRIVWTGENRQETAQFLGRGENGTIVARHIDLPNVIDDDGDALVFVTAKPGDTIIRTGERTYDVERPEDDPNHPDALAEFRATAGPPVGPMPPREPDDTEPEVEHRLKGTRQIAFDFGPNADVPVGGTLVIKSDKLASGFFGLGDIVTGTFTARVVDVAGKERLQRASEEFRAQPQHHVALITEISVD